MKCVRTLGCLVAMIGIFGSDATGAQVGDAASAIRAAMAYTKDRCTVATPCTYRVTREEKLWIVRVQFTRSNAPGEIATPYPRGFAFLHIDHDGKLVKRVDGEQDTRP
jgi:hypothetical protein